MKSVVVILLSMMIGISQASTTTTSKAGLLATTESPAKTATKKDLAHVKSPRISKPKIFRANPHRASYYASVDDSDDISINDDDIHTGYRREEFKVRSKSTKDDPEGVITEEIRWRLFLARTAAMIRYHQIHG